MLIFEVLKFERKFVLVRRAGLILEGAYIRDFTVYKRTRSYKAYFADKQINSYEVNFDSDSL